MKMAATAGEYTWTENVDKSRLMQFEYDAHLWHRSATNRRQETNMQVQINASEIACSLAGAMLSVWQSTLKSQISNLENVSLK